MTDNSAAGGPGAAEGGGAAFCTLNNCILTGNEAGYGGGAYGSTLNNCTVVGNNGGVSGTLYSCIVYYNYGGNYAEGTILNFRCTAPLPTNGVGNITGPPLFMNMMEDDFRLWEGSPCIDAGTNLIGFPIMGWDADWNWLVLGHITDPTDIVGNTRFIDGDGDGIVAWDIGAYEFNSYPPPRFAGPPQLMAHCWRLSITGAPNKWVQIQRSSDLKNWEDCWPHIFMGAEGDCQRDDGDSGQRMMFYRAVVR